MILFFRQNSRSIFLFLIVAAIIWLTFAPIQIGGQVAYVILSGNSMEPDFKVGDLVVVRKSPSYEIDQLVVYDNPKVGFVFHRIIDREDDTFILKGDNNEWLDAIQPSQSDIIGKYWFGIPRAGITIRTLREPVYFAAFTLIILVIIFSLFLVPENKTDKKRKQKYRVPMNKQTTSTVGDTRQELLLLLGIVAAAALILGIVVFIRPLTKWISDDVFYQHQGVISYTAPDYVGIYDGAIIETGDPVYMGLNCIVDMKFEYKFSAQRLTDLERDAFEGTYIMYAKLSDVDGWNRSISLLPEAHFSGTTAEPWMMMDICQFQSLILEKENRSEKENRYYDLILYPVFSVTGTVNGIPIKDTYRPEIGFQMDSKMMHLPEGEDGLALDQEGSLPNKIEVRNSLLIFGRYLDIEQARWISGIVFSLSVIGAIFPAWSLYKDWRKSDISRIQVQYHPLLVDVKSGSTSTQINQVVEVASFTDLAKMAERYGSMILHESEGSFHRYSVLDEQSVYQYTMDVFTEESLFPDVENFKKSLRSALDEDQFELYYQPIVLLKDNSVIGVEAFIRWNHPDFGILYPADFISQAETCDLIPEVDRWVARNACLQLQEWNELGLSLVPVSINISPDTMVNKQFMKDITSIVDDKVCVPELLQIEINRSNLIFQDEKIKQHLAQLNDLGIRLAIDNFATDTANQINQIFQMPIKSVKIDRTITQGIQEDPNNQRMINAVAKMAKDLQVEVVVQGVETKEQIAILKKQDIEFAQGFFLGDPLQANDMATLLEKPKTAAKKSKKE